MSAVVHEAFVQRQHTRYRLPLLVAFAGTTYRAADWSVGGVGLEGVDLDIGVGTVHPLELMFAFQGFTLTVRVDAEIRHVNRQQRRVGFRFIDLTLQQLSLMQFVIDAHLAGEVVDGGDLLEVTVRDNTAAPRKEAKAEAEPRGRRIRRVVHRVVSYGTIFAVFAGILAFVGTNLYDRLFVIRPAMASITGDMVVVAADVAGRVGALAAPGPIAAGDPAFTLTAPDGTVTTVASPCDCRVLAQEVPDGAVVRAGATVLSLVGPDARPGVTVALAYDDLDRLVPGTVARIQYLDGGEAVVGDIRFKPALIGSGEGAGARALIDLDPSRPLDPEMIGQPVNVWFDTSGLPLLAGRVTAAEAGR
jgi:alginate biosynthesis protein Alg44